MPNAHERTQTVDITNELITKAELAKRLKLCQRKIELMVNSNEIPIIKIGSSVRFNWLKVLSALEERS